MDDLGDSLVKVATDLVKVGAILPVVGFGCIYCTIWLIESAHGLVQDPPLYWLCFGLGVVFGSIGALTLLCFVGLQWRDRTAMHGGRLMRE